MTRDADYEGDVGHDSDDSLKCYGEHVPTKGRRPDERTHGPVEIEKTRSQGELYWTCPECGWLLKEFMGVPVDDDE